MPIISDLTEREIKTNINNYVRHGKFEGGKYSLAELHMELQRRIVSPFPPRAVAQKIVELAAGSSDGFVTYKAIWDEFQPGKSWLGNASQSQLARALAGVIAYCIDNHLPLVSTLVVRTDSRKHSDEAINNIYNEAKALGVATGDCAKDFVHSQQQEALSLTVARISGQS